MSVTSRSTRKSRPTYCSRRQSTPLPPKSSGQFKTELNKAEEMTAVQSTFVPHHDPPLFTCEECRLDLRERASREICSLFGNMVSESLAKAKERAVAWDGVPRAPMVAPSQLSPLGSADTSATTSPQSASPATSGSPVTAADLATSFYRKPNKMEYCTPLYHPRPTLSMNAVHIPWMETRPSIFTVLNNRSGRTQPPSPFNLCNLSPIAPPSGAMLEKIMAEEIQTSADVSNGRMYTKDLVEEDEDVKILSWERILRAEIKPQFSQENGAFHLDAEVNYDRAEMTWLAEDGLLYTSPMMATEILPAEATAQSAYPSYVVSAFARQSPPVPAPFLPPGLATFGSNDRATLSLYGDDDSVLELLVQGIEPDDSGLDIRSVTANGLPRWMW